MSKILIKCYLLQSPSSQNDVGPEHLVQTVPVL